MDSSDTDTETYSATKSRLGLCEVCSYALAKYCCPKCEVKTCCLNCLNIHKRELKCTGIRDKTKFIPLKQMTDKDFMSDYCFLEECTRYVADRKRDKIKTFTSYNKRLPAAQFKIREAAKERGTKLKFLLPNFTRNAANTSSYDRGDNIIHWRIEWIYPNAENYRIVDEKCSENEKLIDLAEKNLSSTLEADKKALVYYQSQGIGGLTFLLKAEGVKKCKNRFYELDVGKTLRENFNGKTLVEYPVIYVVYSNVARELFDVIDDDEEIERETALYLKELELLYGKKKVPSVQSTASEDGLVKSEEEMRATMQRLEIEKKMEDRRLKKIKLEQEPPNLLFPDEKMLDLLSSDSSDGNETEEEGTQPSKKIKLEDCTVGL
ncbi:hypothetical protein HA402_007542 [Bradysia odoriphaga]|nr:hypothetical protein HA402_007542 [Bradysia odoriphaga]